VIVGFFKFKCWLTCCNGRCKGCYRCQKVLDNNEDRKRRRLKRKVVTKATREKEKEWKDREEAKARSRSGSQSREEKNEPISPYEHKHKHKDNNVMRKRKSQKKSLEFTPIKADQQSNDDGSFASSPVPTPSRMIPSPSINRTHNREDTMESEHILPVAPSIDQGVGGIASEPGMEAGMVLEESTHSANQGIIGVPDESPTAEMQDGNGPNGYAKLNGPISPSTINEEDT